MENMKIGIDCHNLEGQRTGVGRYLWNLLREFNRTGSDPVLLKNKIVILVDDVYTSGTTMRECARTLREGGAREIWGLTVARG